MRVMVIAVEISEKNLCKNANLTFFGRVGMTTKHCCYGTCRSDSRYVHAEHMKDIFYSIPETVLSRMP